MASQRETIGAVGPAMPAGCHVLNVMQQLAVPLVDLAVFVSRAKPLAEEAAGMWRPSLMRNLIQMPPGFEFEHPDNVRGVNQRFVFGPLGGVKIALIRPFPKSFDSCLKRRIATEGEGAPRRFPVEA
jgi:hypothetical protein